MPDNKIPTETSSGALKKPLKKAPVRNRINNNGAGIYSVNEYYIDISRRYRLAKYLTVFLLVSFIIVMLSLNRDSITIENFQYLVRYLDTDSNVYRYTDYKKIAYSEDTEIKFGLYRGDVVIADSTAVNIYSPSGTNILNESSYISNPVIESSGRHLLVYDLGGNSYAFYNTFSKLFGETLPYPITGASNSDSGLYAVVTKTQEYRSAVYIYDRDFGLISRILKDKLVMDTDIKPDGSSVLIVSAFNSGGEFCTEIMTCDPYSDTAGLLITHNDIMPVSACYQADGFTVVCDSKLLFYNGEGILKNEYSFRGEIPVYSLISDEYTFLAFAENVIGDTQRLLIFNTDGKPIVIKDNEIAVPNIFAENTGKKLGDKLILKFDGFKKEYTICAITKDAGFGTTLGGTTRIVMSDNDYEEINSYLQQYKADLNIMNMDVEFIYPPSNPISGKVLNVDKNGRLLILDKNGCLHHIYSGEIKNIQ
jgi:hypothetical protein